MVVRINKYPTEEKPSNSILGALKELPGKQDTEVLMLVHKETGAAYRVLAYDGNTGLVLLEGSNKQRLEPKITEKDGEFYYPLWRS